MRIAYLTHQFPGARSGGIGTYTLQVARALAGLGHEIHLFTFTLPEEVRVKVPPEIHLHEVRDVAERVAQGAVPESVAAMMACGGEAHYRFALATLLCDAVRAHHEGSPLDLVEAPEYEALGLPLLLDPVPNLKVVTHLHLGSAVARAGNGIAANVDDRLVDAMEFAAIRMGHARIAPSRHVVAETSRFTEVPEPTEVVPHPMSVPAQPPHVAPNGPVLFVGRLEPLKGAELLAPAFNIFLARNSDARIRLVGADTQWGGSSVQGRIVQALEPSLRSRVEFVGERSPQEVHEEFAQCRFSICPSLLEAFGYVAAESLIAGRPVVVNDGTGATEVVGNAGLVFQRNSPESLAACMERLYRDSALHTTLCGVAYQRARDLFSVENTVTGRLRFYESVQSMVPSAARHEAGEAIRAKFLAAPSAASPGSKLLAVLNRLAPLGGAKVLLYGAGRYTLRLLAQRRLWEAMGHRVVGLIDDHPRFERTPIFLGLPVTSTKALADRARAGESLPPIILATDTFQDRFWHNTAELRSLEAQVIRLDSSPT